MTTLRPFAPTDTLRFNNVNADSWTATVRDGFHELATYTTSEIQLMIPQYHTGYYSSYTAQWPNFCVTASNTSGDIIAYSMFSASLRGAASCLRDDTDSSVIAKHEPPPPDPNHHGHLTALSISPGTRGTGLARVFMRVLEALSGSSTGVDIEGNGLPNEDGGVSGILSKDSVDAWFVDLFVRCNNLRAVELYERMGYSVYRRVVE